MPLQAEGAARTFRQNVILAATLAGVAGLVNAAGFFVFSLHTSHMTGHVAAIGESFIAGRHELLRLSAGLLTAFVGGAIFAGFAIDLAAKWPRARYTPALAVEALVLAVAASLARKSGGPSASVAAGLCFAMGLQNALVVRISGAVIRTTHLTGVLTDFGLELSRLWRWMRAQAKFSLVAFLRSPELERAWLHLTLLISFLVGATVGPWLVLRVGAGAIAAPCVALGLLILLDLRRR